MEERLQKLMSQAGIASRRNAEEMIQQGRVTINGERATIGMKADPDTDDVRVDGLKLRISDTRIYIMVHKPKDVVTVVTTQRQEDRKSVRDLVPLKDYLYPVGRLDADSEGLVLLTNDGDLAERLTHPRFEHPKVYEVVLYGKAPDETFEIWERGVMLEDGKTLPVTIKLVERDNAFTRIRLTMREGRKRQIRRIAVLLGYPVRQLIRVEFDTLKLDTLQKGEWRYLSPEEVEALKESAAKLKIIGRSKRPVGASSSSPSSSRPRSAASGKKSDSEARPARRPDSRRRTSRSPYPDSSDLRTPVGGGRSFAAKSASADGRSESRSDSRSAPRPEGSDDRPRRSAPPSRLSGRSAPRRPTRPSDVAPQDADRVASRTKTFSAPQGANTAPSRAPSSGSGASGGSGDSRRPARPAPRSAPRRTERAERSEGLDRPDRSPSDQGKSRGPRRVGSGNSNARNKSGGKRTGSSSGRSGPSTGAGGKGRRPGAPARRNSGAPRK